MAGFRRWAGRSNQDNKDKKLMKYGQNNGLLRRTAEARRRSGLFSIVSSVWDLGVKLEASAVRHTLLMDDDVSVWSCRWWREAIFIVIVIFIFIFIFGFCCCSLEDGVRMPLLRLQWLLLFWPTAVERLLTSDFQSTSSICHSALVAILSHPPASPGSRHLQPAVVGRRHAY